MSDTDTARDKWISEERWHIENATTDLSQYMRPLDEGAAIVDASIFTPEGESKRLAQLWCELPVVLITGSLTCPPSRLFNPSTADLSREFSGRLNVAVLYVIDAHPSGDPCPYTGTDWPTKDNQAEGILIRQPRDQEERNRRAAEYRDKLELQVPVYTDAMDNSAWNALGSSPNMAVCIAEGKCIAYQDWFGPAPLAARLREIFP